MKMFRTAGFAGIVETATCLMLRRLGGAAAMAVPVLGIMLATGDMARAQGIVGDGNAVVTGFSGAAPPTQIAPGTDPVDKTVIDRTGASLRVIDLQAPGAPPAGQLIAAPKPFAATAAQIGQVFGVALDKAMPPNIYAAATSIYGLPITGSGTGGQPNRLKQGAPGAAFMPGLFGPDGGPGTIWRIDGATGAVSLHATVTLDGVANTGPALGGLAFHPDSDSLFVADRATGMIHRIDTGGVDGGHYDHGTQGRPAAGLPAVAYDPAQRLDIASAAFKPDDPATWRLAPPARRVFAVAARDGRLYYSVAENLQIWSVGLTWNGTFGSDARLELTVPPGASPSEIASIAFDDRGRMLLAERIAPSGAADFVALTLPGGGRVLRFEPATGGGQRWQPAAGDAAQGLDPATHGNGGVAIGSGFDASGRRDLANCSGSVWWTGEQLAPGGGQAVNGLAGRPEGAAAAWLIDFDDQLDDPQTRGAIGAVAVFRACATPGGLAGAPQPPTGGQPQPPATAGPPPATEPPPVGVAEELPPGLDPFDPPLWWGGGDPPPPPPPPPLCPPGTHLVNNGIHCCGPGQVPGPDGNCRTPCADPTKTTALDMHECRHGFQPFAGMAGPGTPCWNGAPPTPVPGPCIPNVALQGMNCWKCPKPPHATCEGSQALIPPNNNQNDNWSDATCPPACPLGQTYGNDGLCHPSAAVCPGSPPGSKAWPVRMCCLNGTNPNPVTGQCGPGLFVPPQWYLNYLATGTTQCPFPYTWCSFYEFTIVGEKQFGRGSITQHITLPEGSAFPEARVNATGARHCPASGWSCTKSGDGFTCSTPDCGLSPGDKVSVRIEGKVAPNMTERLTAPVNKTACGELDARPIAGRGPATTMQSDDPRLKLIGTLQGGRQASDTSAGTPAQLGQTARKACWSIVLLPATDTAACAAGYSRTNDGQCCLPRQMTASGVCCPAGQKPDARRAACVTPDVPTYGFTTVTPGGDIRSCPPGQRLDRRHNICVAICSPDRVWTGSACGCPPGTVERRGRCVLVGPPPGCGPNQTGTWPHCCPTGLSWDGRRCIPAITPCPPGTTGTPPNCRELVRPCPPDSIGKPPYCRCRPPLVGAPGRCMRPTCPEGFSGTPPHCRKIVRSCPDGMIGTPPHCRKAVHPIHHGPVIRQQQRGHQQLLIHQPQRWHRPPSDPGLH